MKKYCKHCGQRLEEGSPHDCPKKKKGALWETVKLFLIKILVRAGTLDPRNKQMDYYETDKSIVPDSIKLDEGEIAVKQYDIAILRSKLKFSKAKGKLQVTNKRVLFRASGYSPMGKTTYQQELALDKIDGVEIRKDYRFRIPDLLLAMLYIAPFCWTVGIIIPVMLTFGAIYESPFWGMLAAIVSLAGAYACCIPFFKSKSKLLKLVTSAVGFGCACGTILPCFSVIFGGVLGWTKGIIIMMTIFLVIVLILAIPILCVSIVSTFMFCLNPNLRIEIKAGGQPAMQIRHKHMSFIIFNKFEEYSGFAEILPDKDADMAIEELGAMISDIKTFGDIGVEKWKTK